jgi:SAM-dependent methyltransferase
MKSSGMRSLGTKSLAQQRFGAAAADYATSALHASGASLARLVELTRPEPSWRVLDVATGAGHTALAFALHVARVTASDITDEMLGQARKLAAERGLTNFKTVRADAEDLPFPDMSFDLVTCRLAAHHFGDVAAFAAEAFRVLMPGRLLGLVDNVAPDVAITPERSAAELRDDAAAFNAFKKLADPSHVRCLGLGEWERVLTETGFGLVHSECMDKDMAFDPWVKRMRSNAATIARLDAMLRERPLRGVLRPRETDAGIEFTLKEGVMVARKPAGRNPR